MERRPLTAYLIVIGLLSATALVLALLGDASIISTSSIRTDLPAAVGTWTGTPVLYCPDEECSTPGPIVGSDPAAVCPACGNELSAMSPAERRLLPVDTRIMRKLYTSPEGRNILVSIVVMGSDRTSIHRPQMCLEGQGYRIVTHRIVAPPPTVTSRLPSMAILDLVRSVTVPEGVTKQRRFVYAYWYADGRQNTASFLRMQLYMAVDRLFRRRTGLWAYISLFTAVDENPETSEKDVRRLGRQLWSALSRFP